MAIPDYQTLMRPVLSFAANGEVRIQDCVDALADEFQLSDDDRARRLPSGKQTTFANRVHWAKTYLKQAGLVRPTRRAHFEITPRGAASLQSSDKIDKAYLTQFEEFRQFQSRSKTPSTESESESDDPATDDRTPEERVDEAVEEMNEQLQVELLNRIIESPPEFLETLVVDLLIAMGFGGGPGPAGQHLGRTADGGVDGVINQDALGLDQIYVQAKRYAHANGVGVQMVREFTGSLVDRGSNKGVFVTTSYFASPAKAYAERIPQRLILIDGKALARLMIRHGIGVRTTRAIELNRIDLDYFDPESGA